MLIQSIFILALLSAFCILFLTRTGIRDGIRDEADVSGWTFIAKAVDCDFCFSFWVNLIVAGGAIAATGDIRYLPMVFAATPITRYLL